MYNEVDYSVNVSLQPSTQNIERDNKNKLHHGQLLEKAIRNNKVSISEVSRQLNISRRTIYNWFITQKLDLEIIKKIGVVIDHDFSLDLPEEFARLAAQLPTNENVDPMCRLGNRKTTEAIFYWMDRYITLLEKFNEKLTRESATNLTLKFAIICCLMYGEMENYL